MMQQPSMERVTDGCKRTARVRKKIGPDFSGVEHMLRSMLGVEDRTG